MIILGERWPSFSFLSSDRRGDEIRSISHKSKRSCHPVRSAHVSMNHTMHASGKKQYKKRRVSLCTEMDATVLSYNWFLSTRKKEGFEQTALNKHSRTM
jgi:hypothetical protein